MTGPSVVVTLCLVMALRLASLRLRDCRWASAQVGHRVWPRMAGLLQFRYLPSSLALCLCSWASCRWYSLRSGLLFFIRSYSRRCSSLASCAAGPPMLVSCPFSSGCGGWSGFFFLREGSVEGLRGSFGFRAFRTGCLTFSGRGRPLAFLPLRMGSGNRMVCKKVCVFDGSIPTGPRLGSGVLSERRGLPVGLVPLLGGSFLSSSCSCFPAGPATSFGMPCAFRRASSTALVRYGR